MVDGRWGAVIKDSQSIGVLLSLAWESVSAKLTNMLNNFDACHNGEHKGQQELAKK